MKLNTRTLAIVALLSASASAGLIRIAVQDDADKIEPRKALAANEIGYHGLDRLPSINRRQAWERTMMKRDSEADYNKEIKERIIGMATRGGKASAVTFLTTLPDTFWNQFWKFEYEYFTSKPPSAPQKLQYMAAREQLLSGQQPVIPQLTGPFPVGNTNNDATGGAPTTSIPSTPSMTDTPAQSIQSMANTPAQSIQSMTNTPAQSIQSVADTPAQSIQSAANTPAQSIQSVADTPAQTNPAEITTPTQAADPAAGANPVSAIASNPAPVATGIPNAGNPAIPVASAMPALPSMNPTRPTKVPGMIAL
ncbi:hypothetical protein TWF694_011735 [Orbilia ellipsospora]|uniref:Uncharacterized protein n=1 Tax=Orbilia ellipsospora TaxID=2528407 RepID=A0AAV9X6H9_9PEZI